MKHKGPWWLVGNVRTGQELDVADRMSEIGVESYCPIETRMVRPAKKRKPMEVKRAALPGYLMVKRETIDDPETIYQDSRFHYFVQFDEYLATVCQCMINEIRSREVLGAFQPLFVSGPVFGKGEVVKVPDGPCGGMRGMVVAASRGHYLLDNLDFTKAVWFEGLKLLRHSV